MTAPLFPARPDPLRHWRHLAPERVALADRVHDGRWTYAELDARADRWAALLRAEGIGRGAIVAALADNRAELVDLFFACGRVGAALLPLNWRLAPAELGPILADARPALLLGEGRFRAAAEEALRIASTDAQAAGPRWIDLDDEAPRRLASTSADGAGDVEVDAEDAALILYTSGSTGRPKGAVLPHRQIVWNAVATTTAWELGPDDVAPLSSPLFHTGGWNVFATPLWHRGGRVVMVDAGDADGYLAALEEEGCTVALVVPTQLLMLRESPRWGRALPRLRWLISGGAPLPPALGEGVRSTYPLREGYGLTECGPNCFAMGTEEAARHAGAVGRPVPFLETRRVREDGSDAAPDEPGELWLGGPQRFAGYLRDPGRTAEAVTADGWLRTGDLATVDDGGRFRICGRRKEMYISGGENVFPGEVEAVLSGCPGVREVVVVGVPHERWGEVGRAFVVADPAARLDGDAVAGWARERLAGYKVPKQVVLLPEIPRLGSGKPDRAALAREQLP